MHVFSFSGLSLSFIPPNNYSVRIAAVLIFLVFLFSCRKDSFTTSKNAFLTTEADTLHFDTVFTTTGSTTQRFKIFNDNSKGIHISTIQLKGGISSPFKINAMGIPGPVINNIDVADNDSLYVFVSVHINQSNANLPFIVRDSIEVWSNGNKRVVQLEAYGRNAHFIRSKVIESSEVWNNDLPYVIVGGVEVDENVKLTINEGCKVYMHADAPFIISGTLEVLGKKFDSTRVVFTGDRLDEPYRDYPASWPGIYFNPSSKDNVINYGIIKNAYQAIVVLNPSTNGNPKLKLSETIVDNSYESGIVGVNTSITAQNLLVSNCANNVALVGGGNYQFIHATVASYGNNFIPHKTPVLLVSDTYDNATNPLNATFTNCIFWGEGGLVDDEVKAKGNLSGVKFQNVLWKVKTQPVSPTGTNLNQDPLFDSVNTSRNYYDFHLTKKSSPAVDKGLITSLTLDLDSNPRPKPATAPDLGCYEKQ
jgi:hypothetical protein